MPTDQQPQNPYTAGFQKTPEQARHEARAKVFWGDAPPDVIKYLQMQGISYDEACIIADELCTEREKAIRAGGMRKLLMGLGLMAVPGITWLVFMRIGMIQIHLMAITSVIGVGGAYFFLKGTFAFLSPNSETGEVDAD
jgi:hypothetical protein